MNEEYLYKLSVLEQQATQLQEQINLIMKKMQELDLLKFSLEKINKTKEKRILASIGEGIYIDTEIKDKELLINVGNNIFVHKSINSAKKIIDKQNGVLEDVKKKMEENIEKISKELEKVIAQAKKSQEKEESEIKKKK